MRRFRSGTLENSVKRWGPRMPSFQRFKKKQFQWFYFDSNEPLSRSGDTDDFILFNKADFAPGGLAASGCRNISMDLRISVCWTPALDDFGFTSWHWSFGIFVLDQDDVEPTPFVGHFGEHRALYWESFANNTNSTPVITGDPSTFNAVGPERRWTTRFKARQRFIKYDEELRLITQFGEATEDILSQARMFIFGRVSWEAV